VVHVFFQAQPVSSGYSHGGKPAFGASRKKADEARKKPPGESPAKQHRRKKDAEEDRETCLMAAGYDPYDHRLSPWHPIVSGILRLMTGPASD
jgi:hypothetical protein